MPRPRRSPVGRAVRALAFPAVVLAALAFGGWETHRIVLAQQPSTSVIASPAVDASWGRLVVLRTTGRPLATSSGRAVDVAVRVVGTGAGAFDPATVTLRAADGAAVPVTFGATRPVRLVAGRTVEGRLGFALPAGDGALTLVVLDGGAEHLVPLRPGPVGAGELSPSSSWRPAG